MPKQTFLHVIIPQGAEGQKKLESKFEELLLNLRNTVTGERFSFEYFGYQQHTYFFVVCNANFRETIEGLIYSTFPDAEINAASDYTASFDPEKLAIAGASLKLLEKDVYPVRSHEQFEEDSMSRLFSVIS